MRHNLQPVMRSKALRRSSAEAILDCFNRGSSTKADLAELVTIVLTGRIEGWQHSVERLFTEINAQTIVAFFEGRGVDRVRLVAAYERTRSLTGGRSPAFEKCLAGQFVFTS
jgi:hypothetical protein